MRPRRTLTRFAASALLAVPMLQATGIAPASAADDCGSGWHKQSNGKLDGSTSYSKYGRTMKSSISGYVRYCTRERSARPDQWNQKVLIGIPTIMVSHYKWSGTFSKKCMRQTVTVVFAHENETQTVGISGKDPGFSVSFSDKSVTFSRSKCTTAKAATFEETGLRLTAHNQSGCTPSTPGSAMYLYCRYEAPHVDRVVINTTTSGTFRSGGVERNPAVTHSETDTSGDT